MRFFYITLLTCFLSACSDSQDLSSKSHEAAATQQRAQALITKPQELAFPPSICQRHERRNYQAALDTVDGLGNPIVLVGESHGNRNGIEFIHDYILRRLADDKKVLLSLETSLDGSFVFDKVWKGETSLEEAWNSLPQSWFWNENTDGRQSCAIALLMNDLLVSGHSKQIELLLTETTPEDRKNSRLKGHVMAEQLHERMQEKNVDADWSVISLTGRNYQRVRLGYSVEEQSTMCGRLRQLSDKEVLCLGTYGSRSSEVEKPCPADEAFDVFASKAFEDPWGFYEDLDSVLISPARCADFTPRALETRADFLGQKYDPQ